MLHLLPEDQKTEIRNEYRMRLGILAALCVIIVAIVGIVFLVPSYVTAHQAYMVVSLKKTNLDKLIAEQQGGAKGDVLKKIDEGLSVLAPLGSTHTAGEVFDRILSHTDGVSLVIQNLSYVLNTDKTVSVGVSGVAQTRDDLSSFSQDIKSDGYFKNISLPLSSFTKQTNVDFSIKMSVQK